MKIRTNPERGAILTSVLLGLAAWALVLLNYNSSNSNSLRHRLKVPSYGLARDVCSNCKEADAN